jgi:hypothetical protein
MRNIITSSARGARIAVAGACAAAALAATAVPASAAPASALRASASTATVRPADILREGPYDTLAQCAAVEGAHAAAGYTILIHCYDDYYTGWWFADQ